MRASPGAVTSRPGQGRARRHPSIAPARTGRQQRVVGCTAHAHGAVLFTRNVGDVAGLGDLPEVLAA
ncbi:MAG: hypothetical protein IR158_10335 [Cellulomonas sp.]|uniref:hypothetical protein n=1 Tax=Cellulomonas sp. TaxID=40001 RepID=UPI0019FE2E26|nr:hypothetical protein [Cellulomonas sp.]MBF0688142.1 hypothetical protein [Cellulomonas sp.]